MIKTDICTTMNNVYCFATDEGLVKWFTLNGRRFKYNSINARKTYDIIKVKDKRDNKLIAKSMMSKLNHEKVPYNSYGFINMFIYLLSILNKDGE